MCCDTGLLVDFLSSCSYFLITALISPLRMKSFFFCLSGYPSTLFRRVRVNFSHFMFCVGAATVVVTSLLFGLMSKLLDQYKEHYGKFYFSNLIILLFVDGTRGFGGGYGGAREEKPQRFWVGSLFNLQSVEVSPGSLGTSPTPCVPPPPDHLSLGAPWWETTRPGGLWLASLLRDTGDWSVTDRALPRSPCPPFVVS